MNRTELPKVIKNVDLLEANVRRKRTKPRKSLWDPFFPTLESGDAFEIEALEVNTVKAHASKHGFALRHKKLDGTTVLAQVIKFEDIPLEDEVEDPAKADVPGPGET